MPILLILFMAFASATQSEVTTEDSFKGGGNVGEELTGTGHLSIGPLEIPLNVRVEVVLSDVSHSRPCTGPTIGQGNAYVSGEIFAHRLAPIPFSGFSEYSLGATTVIHSVYEIGGITFNSREYLGLGKPTEQITSVRVDDTTKVTWAGFDASVSGSGVGTLDYAGISPILAAELAKHDISLGANGLQTSFSFATEGFAIAEHLRVHGEACDPGEGPNGPLCAVTILNGPTVFCP